MSAAEIAPESAPAIGDVTVPGLHRSASGTAPVKIVLVSGASASGKSFALRRLAALEELRGVAVYEMDTLFYYVPERLAAGLGPARERFAAWRRAEPPSPLADVIAANLAASTPEHELIKLKLLELAAGAPPVVTVNPATIRRDPEAVRFLRALEAYFSIRVRHVLLHPTTLRYLANLRGRPRPRFDPLWWLERRRLHWRRGSFDGVLRTGLRTPAHAIERFFHEQLR